MSLEIYVTCNEWGTAVRRGEGPPPGWFAISVDEIVPPKQQPEAVEMGAIASPFQFFSAIQQQSRSPDTHKVYHLCPKCGLQLETAWNKQDELTI